MKTAWPGLFDTCRHARAQWQSPTSSLTLRVGVAMKAAWEGRPTLGTGLVMATGYGQNSHEFCYTGCRPPSPQPSPGGRGRRRLNHLLGQSGSQAPWTSRRVKKKKKPRQAVASITQARHRRPDLLTAELLESLYARGSGVPWISGTPRHNVHAALWAD